MLNFIALGCLEVTEKFQLPCNPNLGLDWIELGWKLGWVVTKTNLYGRKELVKTLRYTETTREGLKEKGKTWRKREKKSQ